MCMNVCMLVLRSFTFIYGRTTLYVFVCTYVCIMWVYTYVRIQVCMYVHMHARMYICTYTLECMYVGQCINLHYIRT
jgi:hypothetical protein